MDVIYNWVKDIVFFLIWSSLFLGLLPGHRYEKYIKLYIGMVLIIIAAGPLLKGQDFNTMFLYSINAMEYSEEQKELKEEILGVEKKQIEKIKMQYQDLIQADVKKIAEQEGYAVKSCTVNFDRDENGSIVISDIHLLLEGTEKNEISDGKLVPLRYKIAASYGMEVDFVYAGTETQYGS